MTLIITTLGFLFIDNIGQKDDFNWIKQSEVIGIVAKRESSGGHIEFNMINTMSDSSGMKPIYIQIYSDGDYARIVDKLKSHLNSKKGKRRKDNVSR